MNLKKTLQISILFLLTLVPSLVFAYSSYVIPGGVNVGIELKSKYVSIVGFYKVDDRYIAEESGFQIGDSIVSINGETVEDIDHMIKLIDKHKEAEKIDVLLLRNGREVTVDLDLEKDSSGIYKTGIYVKDKISGIGTLTYIDPETLIYGALGHEIADRNTMQKVELKEGKIFQSTVTNIKPSINGTPGEKQAKLNQQHVYGSIVKNEESGIFGTFTGDISFENTIKVGKPEEVRKGKAIIRTVLHDEEIEEFEIEILEINNVDKVKNMLLQITDSRLLEETGGIVAGMSGSPIIQNGKLIGAVTHVVVNDTDKGYGIFITNMLEEGEREE